MGSLGEKEQQAAPQGHPEGEHSFSRIVLEGSLWKAEEWSVFNIVAAISTWLVASMALLT